MGNLKPTAQCAQCAKNSESEMTEMTPEQKEAIVYRSKLLNKYYESYADLVKDETEFKRQNDEKQKLADVKRARAKEVEDAYQAYLNIKKEAFKNISEAEKKYTDLRDKFAQDYHGYHYTYVNDNGKESIIFGDLVEAFFKTLQ